MRTTNTRTMYMHTLNGKPASCGLLHGKPFVFFVHRGPAKLVPTLRELRKQQCASQEADRADGFTPDRFEYGYVLVQVPA